MNPAFKIELINILSEAKAKTDELRNSITEEMLDPELVPEFVADHYKLVLNKLNEVDAELAKIQI